jgi:protein arginine kinase activator
MLCQRCKKQEATVHLTDIAPQSGEKKEKHLCDTCAQQEGVTIKPHPLPLNELLNSFVMASSGIQELVELKCEHCGLSFVEFRNQGLLGCPHDYEVFTKPLQALIERAHEGATHHVGKRPRHSDQVASRQQDLSRLRRELDAAVEREDYRLAAKLRDGIRALQGGEP